MKKLKKSMIIVLCVVILLGSIMAAVDFCRLHYGAFETPFFVIGMELADDGGSGTYRGLFHRIEIKGNFMPEDEYPGITKYEFYLFGLKVDDGIRD